MFIFLTALSQDENEMGRFLREQGSQDKSKAGKMMIAVGKAQSYSAQQRYKTFTNKIIIFFCLKFTLIYKKRKVYFLLFLFSKTRGYSNHATQGLHIMFQTLLSNNYNVPAALRLLISLKFSLIT